MSDLTGAIFGEDQHCFGCGPKHPFGFRLHFKEDGESVTTRFLPETNHQGAPGIMHGGLVFTIADELAAWVVVVRKGKFGFTTRFSGKLQNPARLGLEVTGRGQITRSTGRTAEIEVVLSQAGSDIFAGTFTFVLLDRAATEKLLGRPLPAEWERYAR